MPDAGALATILLILGLFLVALELMVPSFGLIGISATVCLIISLWSAGQAWWGSQPGFFWTYMLVWMGGIPSVLVGMLYLIQNTALGNFVILKTRTRKVDGASPEIRDHLQDLVGQSGRTVSPLLPGGMVVVNGERHHAECVGPMLESGEAIDVVDTRATRLVVRRQPTGIEAEPMSAPDNPPPAVAPSTTDSIPPSDGDQLDFDIPDNYTAKQQAPPGPES